MTTPLPQRFGPRPQTSKETPHTQLDQQPNQQLISQLAARMFELPGVHEEPSAISVPGARALVLDDEPAGPPEAFMIGREFAHLHPSPDMSLHLALPSDLAAAATDTGWAEPHPAVRLGLLPGTFVMVYAPRNDEELEVVLSLVRHSHAFATTRPSTAS